MDVFYEKKSLAGCWKMSPTLLYSSCCFFLCWLLENELAASKELTQQLSKEVGVQWMHSYVEITC